MNLDQLTEAVLEKLADRKPRALLIGEQPEIYSNYNYVNEKPYEAIVLGALPPGELLHMPNDVVCCALLEQMPVYLWQHQPWKKCAAARMLCRELAAAEQHLYRLGVVPLDDGARVLTATAVREMLQQGKRPVANCRMTPLARDILEGKAQ